MYGWGIRRRVFNNDEQKVLSVMCRGFVFQRGQHDGTTLAGEALHFDKERPAVFLGP